MKSRLKFFAVMAAGLLAASAQAGVSIEHWQTASGARVYFVASKTLPMLDVQVDFAAGGAVVPAERVGLAGLTQGLMDTGVPGMDEEMIADALADSGAQLGGGAEMDRASFSLRSLSSAKERDASLALMQKILSTPIFPANVIAREKARLIASIKESDTQPGSILSRQFGASVYPAHPYGRSASVESVSAISRDDLVNFHRANYCASRAVVSIVGDASREDAEKIAERLTSSLPTGCAPATLADPALPAGGVVRIDHPSAQSHLAIGMPFLRRGDKDLFPLVVGNYVLGGGGFVSRLLKEVREKRGYAYSAYSYFSPQRVEGVFQIGLQTKAEQTEDALKVARATLEAFLLKGPTEEELRDAKRNIINGFVLRVDSNRKLLEQIAVIGFYGLPLDYLDTYPKNIEKVSAADIRDAFRRRLLPEHLVTVIVGPTSAPATQAAADEKK